MPRRPEHRRRRDAHAAVVDRDPDPLAGFVGGAAHRAHPGRELLGLGREETKGVVEPDDVRRWLDLHGDEESRVVYKHALEEAAGPIEGIAERRRGRKGKNADKPASTNGDDSGMPSSS